MAKDTVVVSSKAFTENYILAEIIAQTLEEAGEVNVERKFGLGGTGIIFEALSTQKIHINPGYTGTIAEAILKNNRLVSIKEINRELKKSKLMISESFGFNNTYAMAVRSDYAKRYNLNKISDLQKVKDIKATFTHEFIYRKDGLKALEDHYNISIKNFKSMEHSLSYESISSGDSDIMEAYSTDSKIKKFNLVVLKDDLNFFPAYYPVLFAQLDFPSKYPQSWKLLISKLVGKLSNDEIVNLNSMMALDKKSEKEVAKVFLGNSSSKDKSNLVTKISPHLFIHLQLVFIPLVLAVITGLLLGILGFRHKLLGQFILIQSSIFQTIPSLALLCFLIPLFGIGKAPAYVALYLYALMPIVRGVYTGLESINVKFREYSSILGLNGFQKLIYIELPLASRNIMNGIKTSAVINVGTATLAAFIGAGGLGDLIVRGLTLNDQGLILLGAVPAALLAIIVHYLFELLDRYFIPKGV